MGRIRIDDETLCAYLKGELDTANSEQVEAWYNLSETNRKRLGEIYYLLYLNDRINDAAGINVEKSIGKFKALRNKSRKVSRPLGRFVERIVAAAAIIFIAVVGAWSFWIYSNQYSNPIQITTQLGERSQIVLPDGTKVWLNSCSHLEYVASSLFARGRKVKMAGEAYFEVARDEHNPFIVSADGLNVKVLGTKFNIFSDEKRHQVTTALLEGSVEVSAADNAQNSAILQPLQSAVYNTQSGGLELLDYADARNSIRWINGQLHFNQKPFEEIVGELQRYYNTTIRFKDETLRQECFSGDFEIADGIYHIMSVLSLTYKFRYEIIDNDIYLYTNKTHY